VRKVALYEPPCIVDDSRPAVPADFIEHLARLVAAGRRGDAVAYFLMEGPGVPAEVIESMRREPSWSSFEALAHTLVYDGTIMTGLMDGTPAPLDRWASLDVPTLVIDGDASPPWQRNAVAALTAVLPHARRRSLAGQNHGPAAELLAPVIAAYYAG
jgi:pimeloyl-ACP methyl ester carboxylesterase